MWPFWKFAKYAQLYLVAILLISNTNFDQITRTSILTEWTYHRDTWKEEESLRNTEIPRYLIKSLIVWNMDFYY